MKIFCRYAMAGGVVAVGGGAVCAPASAQTMAVTVEIPRLSVAEYHRPYVAIWLEKKGDPARTLAVWYDHAMKAGEGTKWLRDMRQWWRQSGRSLTLPADGISGATRAPGEQKISFTAGKGSLGKLAPGNYSMVVEAAREVGGRELVRLDFAWPPKPGSLVRAAGNSELGAVSIRFGK